MNRQAYIDALRGFAITGVFITHAASLVGLTGKPGIIAAGMGTGVLLFFVVSACTIFMTLTAGVARERYPYRNFYIKRLMRLLPVYWIGIVLYTVVYGLGSRGWRPGPEWWHFPLHAALLNDWVPSATSSVVPGGWSISCEAMFYLTVPLLFAVARSWRSAAALLVALMVGGSIAVYVQKLIMLPHIVGLEQSEIRQYFYRSIFSQLGTFGFGIVLFYMVREQPRVMQILSRWWINLATIGIGGLIWLAEAFRKIPLLPSQYVYGLAYLLFGLALAQVPWRVAVNKVTTFVGRISYSGYLAHFLVLFQIDRLIAHDGHSPNVTFLILFATAAPITIALAYLGFRFVETPTTQLAKRWINRHEDRSATSATAELQTAP